MASMTCIALISGFIACYQGHQMVCTDDVTIRAITNVDACPQIDKTGESCQTLSTGATMCQPMRKSPTS